MKAHHIPFRDTGYFSQLICDYIDRSHELKQFYGNYPDMNGFSKQLEEKSDNFSAATRKTLVEVLRAQSSITNTSEETLENIELLRNQDTFTVTTGHQLNLFTGPLYFLYKICTAINLARELKVSFPEYDFVPVYWMATEDHDFEEINFFNFGAKKIVWEKDSKGAVGRLDLKGLDVVFESWAAELENSSDANYLKDIFKESYLKCNNLAQATRCLVNELFGAHGLVIIDGDSEVLKRAMQENVREELLYGYAYDEVTKTNQKLQKFGKIQVNPREINLFYLKDGLRERIVKYNGDYKVNGTEIVFSEKEILEELDNHPERFSPNVILRPLYQEIVLPNLCYIGGGGELAYWFQLKSYFEKSDVTFPILMLRQSVAMISSKQLYKSKRLNLSFKDLFQKQDALVDYQVKKFSEISIDFSPQRLHLKKQFEALKTLSNETDPSFLGAVLAQEKKQLNGLDKLEKRLLKAQKRKMSDFITRIKQLQNEAFPNQSLEERTRNFSEFYLHYGTQFIPDLLEIIDPMCQEFTVVEY